MRAVQKKAFTVAVHQFTRRGFIDERISPALHGAYGVEIHGEAGAAFAATCEDPHLIVAHSADALHPFGP